MSLIGKTIRGNKIKGVVLVEYIGAKTFSERKFERYGSKDNTDPHYSLVGVSQASETCYVIEAETHREHHVFASDVISFNEENYQKNLLKWKTVKEQSPYEWEGDIEYENKEGEICFGKLKDSWSAYGDAINLISKRKERFTEWREVTTEEQKEQIIKLSHCLLF